MAVSDNEDAVRQFMAEGGYTFPVMLDSDGLAARYGVRAIPTFVLINAEGRVARTIVGGITTAVLSSLVDDLTR